MAALLDERPGSCDYLKRRCPPALLLLLLLVLVLPLLLLSRRLHLVCHVPAVSK